MTSATAPQNSGSAGRVSDPQYLTAPEVAEVLRVDVWAVVKLCRDGKLVATKPGQKWLITPAALEAYLASGLNTSDQVSA